MAMEATRQLRISDRTVLNIPPATASQLNLDHGTTLALLDRYPHTTDLTIALPGNAPENATTVDVRLHNGEYIITIPSRILALRDELATEIEFGDVEGGSVSVGLAPGDD